MKAKELLPSIDNFINALSHTHHVDKCELFELASIFCQSEANRLKALDPNRNR